MGTKQKVLLVRCNYLPGPVGRLMSPPLGLLSLAAVLRKERPQRIEIKVMDTGTGRLSPKDVGRIIESWAPDVVGVSALSLEAANIHALAAISRQVRPEATFVVGGPHSTIFYDLLLMDKNVDYAVIGEGEITFLELLDHLYENTEPKGVLGLAYHSNGELVYGGDRPYIEDMDSLPMPAWDLIDFPAFSRNVNMAGFLSRAPYATIFTSRACPYHCVYCHGIFGKKFRAQSPERVLDEIEWLSKKLGVRELHVHDDVFNFDRQRLLAIAEGVQKRGVDMKFAFPNAVRGDLMTRDIVKALADAGTYSITYAIETASPRLQRLIKKNLNLDRVFDAIEWTADEGLIPAGFFMLGFPSETPEEIEQTVEFACKSRLLKAAFFSVVAFPRTQMLELVKETYPDYKFKYEIASSMHYFSSRPYYTDVTGIDIVKIQKRAWMKFYLEPWRFFKILKKYPKNRAFINQVLFSVFSSFLQVGRPDDSMRELLADLDLSFYSTE